MAGKHTATISTTFYDEILVPAGLVKLRAKAEARICGKGRETRRQTIELPFHSLRHTSITRLQSAGAGNALAQMIVGHDLEIASRGYAHLDAGDTQGVISRLPDITGAGK